MTATHKWSVSPSVKHTEFSIALYLLIEKVIVMKRIECIERKQWD